MRRPSWIAFFVVQAIGVVCYWTWPRTQSALGPWLWGRAALLLLPGGLLSSSLVPHAFWNSTVTLPAMAVADNVLAILINAGVWIGCATLWSRLRATRVK